MILYRVVIYEKKNGDVIVSRMSTGLVTGLLIDVVASIMDHATKEREEIYMNVFAKKLLN